MTAEVKQEPPGARWCAQGVVGLSPSVLGLPRSRASARPASLEERGLRERRPGARSPRGQGDRGWLVCPRFPGSHPEWKGSGVGCGPPSPVPWLLGCGRGRGGHRGSGTGGPVVAKLLDGVSCCSARPAQGGKSRPHPRYSRHCPAVLSGSASPRLCPCPSSSTRSSVTFLKATW